ncbi:acyltransferase family protein [Alteromonas lipolytica]|uniref:Uncharacterized protein n=1 Tax=Alteromonas lipolytica TaxID=1856405 RepID=A0A1E8F944_9ALTE|nr:DUF5009 domain-containing protein [Alteromonas lipolytica]OFI32434.1 hypothetical protein BFC17_06890 [Alteromonas lipolytica]GGF79686.1 membrane protein [Alteromonas lipolytica]
MTEQARLSALDALRGLAIFAMVLVNNPGSWQAIYAPLKHAQWHGITPTDVIFPAFIFVMGITIAIHLPRELAVSASKVALLARATKRALTLILLGWLLFLFWVNTGDPAFNWLDDRLLSLRFGGVLPRLGMVYWLTVVIVLMVSWRWLGVTAIMLLGVYWGAMALIPYTDSSGQRYQGLWEFGNSLAAFIDHHVLGAGHVYYANASPFAFDPEGLLSTLPAVVSCLTGVWVGRYVLVLHGCPNKLMSLALAGICGGFALATVTPLNKALWSPTFVMVTSGILTVMFWLAVLYERKRGQVRPGHPLLVAGTNSIAFFMLSGVLARLLLMIRVDDVSLKSQFYHALEPLLWSPQAASLAFALVFTVVCYYPVKLMYNNNFFWRV